MKAAQRRSVKFGRKTKLRPEQTDRARTPIDKGEARQYVADLLIGGLSTLPGTELASLILGWHWFDMVDRQDFQRLFVRFQFKPESLLNGCEDIKRTRVRAICVWLSVPTLRSLPRMARSGKRRLPKELR